MYINLIKGSQTARIVMAGCLLFLCYGFSPVKQEYTYRKYTILDGLPQMQVTHLMQDSKGYIWASHWNGISRFNGKKFQTFSKDEGLYDHAAFCAIEYQPDSFAVISPNGMAFGNEKGFKPIKFPSGIVGARNSCLYQLQDNRLLITNLKHYPSEIPTHLFYNALSGTFTAFNALDSIFIHEVSILQIDKGFRCYTAKAAFDSYVSGETKTHPWTRAYSDFAKLSTNDYFAYCGEDEKLYRIGTQNEEQETNIKLPDACSRTESHVFTVINQNKAVYYNNDFELFLATAEAIQPTGRKFNLIRNFMTDREGNLWLATEEGIFNYFHFAFCRVKLFPSDFYDTVWSIAQTSDGKMLFGAYNRGLYQSTGAGTQKIDLARLSPSVPSEDVNKTYMGAARNSKGDVYIPLRNRMLRWDKNNAISVTPMQGTPQMVVKDRKSDTLFAAFKGGMLLITPNGEYREITKEANFENYQNESIAKDKYGHYWLGASQRSFLQVYDGAKVRKWQGEKAQNIISLASDYKGNIWMGNHKGLFLYDHKQEREFAADIIRCPIYSIVPYADSLLLLGTPQELYVVNIRDFYEKGIRTINRYNHEAGFTAEGMVQNSFCIDNAGDVWMPSFSYSCRIHPGELRAEPLAFAPIIDSVSYSDDRREWTKLEEHANEQILPAGTKHLLFAFESLTYNTLQHLIYRYRLIGYDSEQFILTKESKVTYNNLPPGQYRLEVQASVEGGAWSDTCFSSALRITPFLWQIRKVQVLTALLVLIFLAGAFKLYFDRIRKRALRRQENEQEIRNLQLANIESRLDPHFIFNVINSVASDILIMEKNRAYTCLLKLSGLISETLSHAKNPLKTLRTELRFTENYLLLQKYRFGERLAYSITLEPAELDVGRTLPKMLVQVLVENAMTRGIEKKEQGGKIWVTVSEDDERWQISVQDTGPGIDVETLKKEEGTGIKSIHEILAVYDAYNKQKVSFTLKKNKTGTLAQISIPLNYRFELNN